MTQEPNNNGGLYERFTLTRLGSPDGQGRFVQDTLTTVQQMPATANRGPYEGLPPAPQPSHTDYNQLSSPIVAIGAQYKHSCNCWSRVSNQTVDAVDQDDNEQDEDADGGDQDDMDAVDEEEVQEGEEDEAGEANDTGGHEQAGEGQQFSHEDDYMQNSAAKGEIQDDEPGDARLEEAGQGPARGDQRWWRKFSGWRQIRFRGLGTGVPIDHLYRNFA